MKKKIKRIVIVVLIFLALALSAVFPKMKDEFYRKFLFHKKHQKPVKIKAIDTSQLEKDVMRKKLFTRQQWFKKRKIEAQKYAEKQEKIKRDTAKREVEKEQLRKQNIKRDKSTQTEKPYIEKEITVTAYTNSGGPGHGITASGAHTQEGVTLAAPSWVPMGSVVEIEGVGRRIVQDRGGRITGNTFDLFVEDQQHAIQFGRRTLKARIYKN